MLNQFVRGEFPTHTQATIGAEFMKKTVKINGYTVTLQIWDTAGQERFRSMVPMYYRGVHGAVLVYDVSQPESLERVHSWVEELQRHAANSSPTGSTVSDTADELVMIVAGNKSDLRDENATAEERNEDTFVDQQAASRYADSISQNETSFIVDDMHAALGGPLICSHLVHSVWCCTRVCRVSLPSRSDARIFETSAKTGAGVNNLFHELARMLVERHVRASKAGTRETRETTGVKGDASKVKLAQRKRTQDGCC